MPWWGWIVLGALLLSAELALVDLEFYLVFIGLSALVVGGLGWAGIEQPAWAEWLEFAGLALVACFGFRGRVYAKLRPAAAGVGDALIGEWATAGEAIAPGASGRVTLRGTTWRARNAGAAPIAAGASARVVRLDGLTLELDAGPAPDASREGEA